MKKQKPQDIVYEYIKGQIIRKAMFPGNRIFEEEIVKNTGVSRTSIRPALLRLQYEGMVDIVPHRGTFVAKPSEADLRQVFRMRRVLESGALEEAIEKRSDKHIRAMEKNLQEQLKLSDNYSRQGYVELNHQFHWIIVEATGNVYYEKYLNEIYNRVETFLIFYDTSVENDSIESHRKIFEGLRDRDLKKGLEGIVEDIDVALIDLARADLRT